MNPPPPPEMPPGRKPFAGRTATASLVAPLLAVPVTAASRFTTPGTSAGLVLGGLVILLVLVGLALSILALASITRDDTQGTYWRGVAGAVINGLFLCLFAFIFVSDHARAQQSRAQAVREMQSAESDLRASMKKSFNPKTGMTNFDLAKLDQFEARLTNAAKGLSSDDVKMSQAMSAFFDRMKLALGNYQLAATRLRQSRVLGPIQDKSVFAERREIVQQFLDVNDQLTGVITNGEDSFRQDLTRFGLPPGEIEQAVAGYRHGTGSKIPLNLELRACDDRIGHATLDALDVLETQWGRWRYDSETNRIRFENSDARAAYAADLSIINSNAQLQLQLQKRLVNQQ